jgi:hypothetical protein
MQDAPAGPSVSEMEREADTPDRDMHKPGIIVGQMFGIYTLHQMNSDPQRR